MSVYADSIKWAKHGNHFLPSNLSLTSIVVGLHQSFYGSLIDFLCTDLDGNLSFTLNPFTASKLDEYFATLFKGLPDTTTKVNIFEKIIKYGVSKQQFIDNKILNTAILATMIPLSMFTFFPQEV
jgi:hypothetical protein